MDIGRVLSERVKDSERLEIDNDNGRVNILEGPLIAICKLSLVIRLFG